MFTALTEHFSRKHRVNGVTIISNGGKIPDRPQKSAVVRVLVVDDEALIRWSLVQTLDDGGHETAEADNAVSAIKAVLSAPRPFDVVLLDLRLPDAKDLELLSTLRRLSPSTQIILMTAYGTPEVVQGAIDLGAFRVVGKPLEMSDVSALVACASAAAAR
jgi:two-component system response regulator (stage 0 sporulation protein F)